MMTDLLCATIGEVAKPLATRMEVEVKNKGYSTEECCTALVELAQQFEKADDPFCNFQNGGGATAQPPVDQGAKRGGPGLGTRREADGGSAKPTTGPTAEKKPYFDGDRLHCGKKGHMALDCRNKHLPAVKRDQVGGHSHVQGGGQGHIQQVGPSRRVAAAFKKLTVEKYQELMMNQKPKGCGLPLESFVWKPGLLVPGLQQTAPAVGTANRFEAMTQSTEVNDYSSWEYEESPTTRRRTRSKGKRRSTACDLCVCKICCALQICTLTCPHGGTGFQFQEPKSSTPLTNADVATWRLTLNSQDLRRRRILAQDEAYTLSCYRGTGCAPKASSASKLL
jgi:hypothetical protein